jgi:hypothetical protein
MPPKGYWFNAKYRSKCATKDCENALEPGSKAFYYCNRVYCQECGKELEPA